MPTITIDSTTITPTHVYPLEASRAPQTVEHDIIGSEESDYTMRPAKLTRGTLRMLFDTYGDALEALTAHAGTNVCTLTDSPIDMTYVVVEGSDIAVRQAPDGLDDAWQIEVPYRELPA